MRRHEKEITDKAQIEDVIRRAKVCRLGLCDQGQPYVVPLCFGYENDTLYCHSAPEGRKLDMIRSNPKVCFELDVDQEFVPGAIACKWSLSYRSVIGFGTAALIEDAAAKRRALDVIMAHYADGPFTYEDQTIERMVVIQVAVEHMTGKQSGY